MKTLKQAKNELVGLLTELNFARLASGDTTVKVVKRYGKKKKRQPVRT